MTLEDRALKICNCNKTIALDAKALVAALKLTQPIQMHTELCRKEVGSFQESLKGEACVVACTQEAPLFSELAREAGAATGLKFINIREHLLFFLLETFQATADFLALLFGFGLLQCSLKFLQPIIQVLLASGKFLQPILHLQLLATFIVLRALRLTLGLVAIVRLGQIHLVELTLHPGVMTGYAHAELADRLNLAIAALRDEAEAENRARYGGELH